MVSKKKKKGGNFPHFWGGTGGGRPISPLKKKKNRVSKCIKSPKYSFKSNLFFSYGGGLTLRIFLSSRFWFVLYQRLFLGKPHEAIPLTILVIVPLHQPSETQCWQDRGGF